MTLQRPSRPLSLSSSKAARGLGRGLGVAGVMALLACGAELEAELQPAPDDLASASSSGDNAVPGEDNALRRLILGLEGEPTPEGRALTESELGSGTENHDGQLVSCVYKRYQGVELYDTLVSFDPNGDALWPGSVVQTRNLGNGLLEPIGLARRPGTLTFASALGDVGEGGSLSRTLANPSLSSTQDAINSVLRDGQLSFPTKVNYRAEEAHSLTEAASKVGLAVEWMSGAVKSRFDGQWSDKQTSFIVNFTQNFYTVSFEPPASPEAVFAPETTVADAQLYMGPGNLPGYVAGVTYGRMLLVKIESNESSSALKAALDVAFDAGAASGEVETGVDYKKVLREADVSVFALGGDGALATEIMTNSNDRAEKIAAYLRQGATFSPSNPGVPISYTVRSLANNQLMKVASTLDYEVPVCSAQLSRFRVVLDSVEVPDTGRRNWYGSSASDLDVRLFARSALMNGTGAPTAQGPCSVTNPEDCGKKLFEQSYEVSNGAVLPITQSKEHRVEADARDGERLDLVLWAKNTRNDKTILAFDIHNFTTSGTTGEWSGLGQRSFEGQASGLRVRVNYHLEQLSP